ncbi:MAG: hypothetical protein HDS87_05360 [Bacteroidales bacterium]|nr:hypothetical protein [Bacteroidales bacterium]
MTIRHSLKYISDFLFSEKEWVRDYAQAPDYYVAAGNPVKGVSLTDASVEVFDCNNKRQLIVAGNSMAPRAIYDGDRITFTVYDNPQEEKIERGTFVVINVDEEYYRSHNKKSKFKNKLRCAICKVDPDISYPKFLEAVKQVEQTAYLEEYQKELENKFKDARAYYDPSEPLMLSVTYKNGEMHYSLHPVNLIKGKVEKVERYNSGMHKWEKVSPRVLI